MVIISARFEGSVSANRDNISLTMKNPRDEYCGTVSAGVVLSV
jgi:hypothetical protein